MIGKGPILRDYLPIWQGHLSHWVASAGDIPVYVFRYEDMLLRAEEVLRLVAEGRASEKLLFVVVVLDVSPLWPLVVVSFLTRRRRRRRLHRSLFFLSALAVVDGMSAPVTGALFVCCYVIMKIMKKVSGAPRQPCWSPPPPEKGFVRSEQKVALVPAGGALSLLVRKSNAGGLWPAPPLARPSAMPACCLSCVSPLLCFFPRCVVCYSSFVPRAGAGAGAAGRPLSLCCAAGEYSGPSLEAGTGRRSRSRKQ